MLDDFGYSKGGNHDQNEREAEEDDEVEFVGHPEVGSNDERYRECDKKYIGDNVGRTHGDELRKALSTLRTRIGDDLPVFIERLTFG